MARIQGPRWTKKRKSLVLLERVQRDGRPTGTWVSVCPTIPGVFLCFACVWGLDVSSLPTIRSNDRQALTASSLAQVGVLQDTWVGSVWMDGVTKQVSQSPQPGHGLPGQDLGVLLYLQGAANILRVRSQCTVLGRDLPWGSFLSVNITLQDGKSSDRGQPCVSKSHRIYQICQQRQSPMLLITAPSERYCCFSPNCLKILSHHPCCPSLPLALLPAMAI